MDKHQMQTVNKADENFKKLAAMSLMLLLKQLMKTAKLFVLLIRTYLCRKFHVRSLMEMRNAISLLGPGQEEICSSCQCTDKQNPPSMQRGKR